MLVLELRHWIRAVKCMHGRGYRTSNLLLLLVFRQRYRRTPGASGHWGGDYNLMDAFVTAVRSGGQEGRLAHGSLGGGGQNGGAHHSIETFT